MSVSFCPIASGSNGNCIFVGTEETKILIDAGLSGIKIENGLKSVNILPESIDGIFITHEHSDHIMGVGVISRRYDIPIYATEQTWVGMENFLGKIKKDNRKIIYKEEKCVINDIIVHPFSIPHDANEPVGYNIFSKEYKITIATDLGHVNDDIRENIYDSDILLIESNHNVDMVKTGSYPYPLKKRILGDFGHLSNENCGKLLTEIMSNKLKHIYLGHLSIENNTPDVAFNTVKNIMESNKVCFNNNLKMSVANRGVPSALINLSHLMV